ncbi:glycosyltransferase, partial [Oerskovia flava]|uniref:glycosyltransferase n=1 Tax=Oerskovia flava TaxID=2986422 RepID=UPI002AD24FE6
VVGDGWLAGMLAALRRAEFVTGSWEGDRLNSTHRASVTWTTNPIVTKPFLPWLPATGAGTMGIDRQVFVDLGGFEESLATGEDVDLSWRVQLAGHRLEYHPEIILHVRKRDGLRAIYRQAYAYGAGDKLLRHRYADVITAYRRAAAEDAGAGSVEPDAAPSEQGTPGRQAPGRWSEGRRRLLRLLRAVRNKLGRGRAGLADTVWRLGERAGHKNGQVDPHAPRVPVPCDLPRPD